MTNKSIIKKKKLFLSIILAVFLVIAIYKFFEYKASMEYGDVGLPYYAQNKTTNEILYVESPKKIAQSMLAGEEYFKGYLKLSYLDIDKAEIKMRNYGTGDDTKEAIEYYVIAER